MGQAGRLERGGWGTNRLEEKYFNPAFQLLDSGYNPQKADGSVRKLMVRYGKRPRRGPEKTISCATALDYSSYLTPTSTIVLS